MWRDHGHCAARCEQYNPARRPAAFYEIIIEIPEMRLTKSVITPDIAAGMALMIDILGDKRTVVDYIIKAIEKSWKTTFCEK